MPTTVWFCRSTTPFYYGEYGVVWWHTTPCSGQYSANSIEVNLPPRSVLSTWRFLPLLAFARILNFLIAAAALSLLIRSYSHI